MAKYQAYAEYGIQGLSGWERFRVIGITLMVKEYSLLLESKLFLLMSS